MIWRTAHRADPFARALADHHTNRIKSEAEAIRRVVKAGLERIGANDRG